MVKKVKEYKELDKAELLMRQEEEKRQSELTHAVDIIEEINPDNVTFDVFFNILISKNKKFRPHHYEAIKIFCEKDGKKEMTIEEWYKKIEKF